MPIGRHSGGVGGVSPPPAPRSVEATSLSDLIAGLADLDPNGLRLRWRNHLGGTPAAHLPRWLLLRVLAYQIQAAALGDLDKATLRVIRQPKGQTPGSPESGLFEARIPTTREGADLRAGTNGASSGIGAVYADRLANRGSDLILVARNGGRLDAVAKPIKDATGRAIEVVAADLNNKADLLRVETLLRTNAGITMLVNNAGVGALHPLLELDVDKMADMIELNVKALTRLTYAVAPGFVARGGGTIINISSAVAVWPELLNVNGGRSATARHP